MSTAVVRVRPPWAARLVIIEFPFEIAHRNASR
jgi:hypothetical protein